MFLNLIKEHGHTSFSCETRNWQGELNGNVTLFPLSERLTQQRLSMAHYQPTLASEKARENEARTIEDNGFCAPKNTNAHV